MKTYTLHDTIIPADPSDSVPFPFTFGKVVLGTKGYQQHSHTYSELVVISGGSGMHNAEGLSYPVRAGDIFILHVGQNHGFSRCSKLEMYNVGFPDSFIHNHSLSGWEGIRALFEIEPLTRSSNDFASKFHAGPMEMKVILQHLGAMQEELRERQPGFTRVFSNLFTNLVIHLGRYYTSTGSLPVKGVLRIARGMSLLEQRFDQDIEICEAAEAAGITPSHFIRAFSRAYGISPLQYILQLRVSKASRLLTEAEMTISEVGYACGFSDSNYFSRVFRKKTGQSPREFRSDHKKNSRSHSCE